MDAKRVELDTKRVELDSKRVQLDSKRVDVDPNLRQGRQKNEVFGGRTRFWEVESAGSVY
ncbi:MAG: hypothetical protein ABI472_05435 [Ginsengibacter sp.]